MQGPILSFELNQEDSKYNALVRVNEMLRIITFSRKMNELRVISQLICDIVTFVFNNALISAVKLILEDHNTYCVLYNFAKSNAIFVLS